MPRITQLENKRSTISDDASILLDRDNGIPLRILGSDFKSELYSRLMKSLEYSFFNLAGDFRPAETKHEFYLYGKRILESYGYDISSLVDSNGIPVLIETDGVLNTTKGWMFHKAGTPNSIKIFFVDGTTATYEENDSTEEETKIFSWKGNLANTSDWLREFDLPGYPLRPSQMWDPDDVRNTWISDEISSIHNQISTESIGQSDSTKRPVVFETLSGVKTLLFSNLTSVDITSFDLSTSLDWTITFWIKPSNRTEDILGNSSSPNSRIILNYDLGMINLIDSTGYSVLAAAPIFDKRFHMISLVSDSTGKVFVYVDRDLSVAFEGITSFTGLDSIGMETFSGAFGFFYIESGIEASLAEIQHLYDRTYQRYLLDDTYDEPIPMMFSDTEVYGFSETEYYAFEI